MKRDNYYYLEYLDYCPYLYCYNHNVSVDTSFGLLQVFMSNSRVYIESRTEPFIWTTRVHCFVPVNYKRVQVLRYRKFSLLFLPVVGIEPATSRWFHSEALSQRNTLFTVPRVHVDQNECPRNDIRLHLTEKVSSWSFEEYEVPFNCNYSQVHSDPG